jgi:sulfotransferase
MARYAFLSGLPRTGSTVLGTLLSQHPDLHPTSTSCTRDLLVKVHSLALGESPYFDVKDPASPAWAIMRGILFGAYEHVTEEIVLEKDRWWSGETFLLTKLLGEQPRVISTVRPIPEIIASFIILSNKIGITSKIEDELRLANRESNTWSLSRIIWEKYVYRDWRTLKSGYEANPECFLFLEYDDIVSHHQKVMKLICTYLDIEPWALYTTGLKNPNPENDKVYGMPGLHDVKPNLKRTSPPAWEILGDECYEFWAKGDLEFWRVGTG